MVKSTNDTLVILGHNLLEKGSENLFEVSAQSIDGTSGESLWCVNLGASVLISKKK
jgi:hypothetical protein